MQERCPNALNGWPSCGDLLAVSHNGFAGTQHVILEPTGDLRLVHVLQGLPVHRAIQVFRHHNRSRLPSWLKVDNNARILATEIDNVLLDKITKALCTSSVLPKFKRYALKLANMSIERKVNALCVCPSFMLNIRTLQ